MNKLYTHYINMDETCGNIAKRVRNTHASGCGFVFVQGISSTVFCREQEIIDGTHDSLQIEEEKIPRAKGPDVMSWPS